MSITSSGVDVCIVGAGLSGAYAAYKLLSNDDTLRVAIIDARSRVGGRLLTEAGGADMGGTWIWPRQEYAMHQFTQQVGVQTLPMHTDGKTIVRGHNGSRQTIPDFSERYAACGGGAVRVLGGAASMAKVLLDDTNPNLSIHLGMKVVRIEHNNDDMVKVICNKLNSEKEVTICCEVCILAAPPKVLIGTIDFLPMLPKSKVDAMVATPTWMEDYGKVAVSFPYNWWRERNLSAVSIDQIGAVSTWWEQCSGDDGDGRYPTLAGFVTAQHGAIILGKMKESPEALFDYIIDSLENLYGISVAEMGLQQQSQIAVDGSADLDGISVMKGSITVTYKSWVYDPYTNNSQAACTDQITTDYGDRQLREIVGPIFFAGTETAQGSGHMEGAIISARRVTEEVEQYLGGE